MKITKITHGHGYTQSFQNSANEKTFNFIRVFNELEAVLDEGEKVAEVQAALRDAVEKLNMRDIKKLLKNS